MIRLVKELFRTAALSPPPGIASVFSTTLYVAVVPVTFCLKIVFTYTKIYRMIYRMKVTAIIADDLVNNVKAYTRSSTVTEAITIALKDWLDVHKIKELNKQISQNPIYINNGQQIREINRSI
jgi:hypothetical protein